MHFPISRHDKVLICILLDGLGYDVVRRTGFLSDLLGEIHPLRTVLGYSCAAQPSILTGKLPSEHGGFCVYYKSRNSIFWWVRLTSVLGKTIRGKLVRNAVPITRRLYGLTGYYSTWKIPRKLLHRFQLYEKTAFYEANPIKGVPTILDEARDAGNQVSALYWNKTDEQMFSETVEKLETKTAGFHFLYLAGTDKLMHQHCGDDKAIEARLADYEERIRSVYRSASRHYEDVRLMVFSDHGMLPVETEIDVMNPVAKLPYTLGKDYLAFYDATIARFWFDNPECEAAIQDTMSGIDGMYALDDEALRRLGCFFPDRRYGETIYLARGGAIISPSFFGSLSSMRGMHGYHPDEPSYEAFVGGSGVDVMNTESITDLHAVMRSCLFGNEYEPVECAVPV
jgi:hypothetical protein